MKKKSFIFGLLTLMTLVSCGENSSPNSEQTNVPSIPNVSTNVPTSKDTSIDSPSNNTEPSVVTPSVTEPSVVAPSVNEPSIVNSTNPSSSNSIMNSQKISDFISEDVKQKYLITFKDENGNLLYQNEYLEGEIPSYNYTKTNNAEYTYDFKGWALTQDGNPLAKLPKVIGPATYYAVVGKVKNKYTIIFDTNGGDQIPSITKDYGTSIDAPNKPKKEGYSFVSWCYDSSLNKPVSWPIVLTKNITLYAAYNEAVDIKQYLNSALEALKQDPYGYIPNSMRPTFSANNVEKNQVTYDFNNFVNVSDITYGGYGEQWNMVIDNINESERFYNVLTTIETVVNTSVVAFNNYLDANPSDQADHTLNETTYSASLKYKDMTLSYSLQYKTNMTIPFFGQITPRIDMTYNISTNEKSVRIQLTSTNAMRYVVTDNMYVFAIEYGVTAVSRKAYFQIAKSEKSIEGHIYEYIQLKGKDMVPSCGDFYINEDYTSVVGNKSSGIVLFDGYINELYKTQQGKLLGYKVKETKTIVKEITFNTLWFNLTDVTGFTNVKLVLDSETPKAGQNSHKVYVNNSASVFEPMRNSVLTVQTSRKYDIELRTQYFYGYDEEGTLTKYEVNIPMMFIQDGDNYNTYEKDIKSKNKITSKVVMDDIILNKIRTDYEELIPLFINNKTLVSSTVIEDYIGKVD